MRAMTLGAIGLAATLVCGATAVRAETIFEVEHARASARAGGPVSERDAELLDRWGALSGTPEWREPDPPRRTPRKRTSGRSSR